MSKFLLGYISACIAGDRRYTDRCEVTYDGITDLATVSVFSTHAAGGMDGPGGTVSADGPCFSESCPGEPKAILDLVKRTMRDGRFNFKQYGKPSKRFSWVLDGRSDRPDRFGLNVNLVKRALGG